MIKYKNNKINISYLNKYILISVQSHDLETNDRLPMTHDRVTA